MLLSIPMIIAGTIIMVVAWRRRPVMQVAPPVQGMS